MIIVPKIMLGMGIGFILFGGFSLSWLHLCAGITCFIFAKEFSFTE